MSGSMAQFSSRVFPGVSTEPIIRLAVAPTDICRMVIVAGTSFFAFALMYPCSISIFAPMDSKPERCMSTGLSPIAHPPGRETSASPSLARSGPIT